MQITLNMLWDLIAPLQPENNISSIHNVGKTSFQGVYLLTAPTDQVDPSLICVCNLSIAIKHSQKSPRVFYLCLRDRIKDAEESKELLDHILVIGINIGLSNFHNIVQAYFYKFERWNSRILEGLIKKEGLQSLLDLSEEILENHVSVFDPTLRLLAHTRNIDPVEERARRMIKLGYHPDEDIQLFMRLRRFEIWVKCDEIIISDLPDFGPIHRLVRSFKVNGAFVMIVTMVCAHRPITPGLIDLYSLFLEKISIYLQRDYLHEEIGDLQYSHFLTELITDSKLNEDFIRSRAKYIGLDYDMRFSLIRISFSDPQNTPHIHVLSELKNLLPCSNPILFDKEIVFLQTYHSTSLSEQQSILQTTLDGIAPLLNKYYAHCGISDICRTLMQIRAANRQASAALELGLRITTCRYLSSVLGIPKEYDKLYFYYSDYAVYDALKIWLENPNLIPSLGPSLAALYAYDKKNNTNNIRFLYFYLLFERNSAQTSKYLHMHRNNISYRVKRIEELTGIQLDDPEVRLRLMLLYRCLELGYPLA